MIRPLTVVLLVLALAVAALAAIVGIAVLRTRSDTQEHRLLAAYAPGAEEPLVHERPLGTRVGESVLDAGEERAYYDAVLLARSAGLPELQDAEVAERRAQAQAILVGLARSAGDPELRSRAANLLGALLFEDAKAAGQNPRRFLEQAYGSFQDAVLADPSNIAAKRNLELLSTLPLQTQFRTQTSPGTEASASEGGASGY